MVLHHNLVLCGMKHLVITMMLLRASTLMEIQVFIMMAIKGFGTLMTSKLSSTSLSQITMTIKHLVISLRIPSHLTVPVTEK
ncbi:hypothetical protein Peur_027089 [Populus x canadensis]